MCKQDSRNKKNPFSICFIFFLSITKKNQSFRCQETIKKLKSSHAAVAGCAERVKVQQKRRKAKAKKIESEMRLFMFTNRQVHVDQVSW